jgi:hypothetical protein
MTDIKTLNDNFRRSFVGGTVLLTQGIRALPEPIIADILIKVQQFNDFNPKNDPYQERDMGKFVHEMVDVIWKIDYYDKDNRYHSPDPSNPEVTNRVLTIMRSDEY